jgi:hypothetical protein
MEVRIERNAQHAALAGAVHAGREIGEGLREEFIVLDDANDARLGDEEDATIGGDGQSRGAGETACDDALSELGRTSESRRRREKDGAQCGNVLQTASQGTKAPATQIESSVLPCRYTHP